MTIFCDAKKLRSSLDFLMSEWYKSHCELKCYQTLFEKTSVECVKWNNPSYQVSLRLESFLHVKTPKRIFPLFKLSRISHKQRAVFEYVVFHFDSVSLKVA